MRSRNSLPSCAQWPGRSRTPLALRRSRRPPWHNFAPECACRKTQLSRFRDHRTHAEHVILPPLDGTQHLPAAAAEQIQIKGQFPIDHGNQGQALLEKLPGVVDLKSHQLAKRRGGLTTRNRVLVHSITLHIVEWQGDSATPLIGGP